jgi:cysteine desulfurase/selenocysteine lyase
LAAAADFIEEIGANRISAHEQHLLTLATEKISELGARIYGTAKEKTSVVSFLFDGLHPYDIGALVDKMGVAVRTGHHCTEPLMQYFNIPGTVRASFAVYNTEEEVEKLIAALIRARDILM